MNLFVYGTGMSGIAHAIALRSAGHKVVLLDSSENIASGWASDQVRLGTENYTLPRGIRIPVLTNTKADDYFFFDKVYGDIDWYKYTEWALEGCIAGPFSNPQTSNLDVRSLGLTPSSLYAEIENALKSDCSTELDRLCRTYGKSITDKVFEPIAKSRLGLSLKRLPFGAMSGLIPTRLIIFDRNKWQAEKENYPSLSPLLAVHERKELEVIPHLPLIFPKNVSINDWVQALKKKLTADDINVFQGQKFKVSWNSNVSLYSVEIEGQTLEAEALIWTKSKRELISHLLPNKVLKYNDKLSYRTLSVAHLLCSKRPKTNHEFAINLSPDSMVHRYMLWQNFKPSPTNTNVISIEKIDINNNKFDQNFLSASITELIRHEYLPEFTKILDVKLIENIANIPIETKESTLISDYYNKIIDDDFPGTFLISSSGVKFLHDILKDAFRLSRQL